MALVRLGFARVVKNDGIYGNKEAGENNLRTGQVVKLNQNGQLVKISADDSNNIFGIIYYGQYHVQTLNGLEKTGKYEVENSGVVVKSTDLEFDSFNKGNAVNYIQNGPVEVLVEADVLAGDDVYYNPTTGYFTNSSTNTVKVGKSKFMDSASNGDGVLINFVL